MDTAEDLEHADLLRQLLDLEDVEEVWSAIRLACAEQDAESLLRAASAWCRDADPAVQATGLDLLGALAQTAPAARDRLIESGSRLLRSEDQTVRWTVAIDLGWGENATDPRSVPLLVTLLTDRDAEVRRRAVVGLNIPLDEEPGDGPIVRALIAAMRDPDADVRDWATFAIGSQRDVDTPEVRALLVERLSDDDDSDAGTAGEAAVGLARRGDLRALEPTLEHLDELTVGPLWIEAATELGDPRLLPALIRLRERGWAGTETDATSLDRAIARCSPSGAPTPDG